MKINIGKKRRASPLVEEGLLIGFSILIIFILAAAIFNIITISENTIGDFIEMFQNMFNN